MSMQLLEEAGGFIDGDHAARGADDLRQIHRGVAGAAPKVKHRLPGLNASTFPELMGRRGPEPVLQAKTHRLVVAGAKNVILRASVARGGTVCGGRGRHVRSRSWQELLAGISYPGRL
ncbi:MAG: hypothetical protein NTV94_01300 [Planctomycetota bacterium]|nr:hypothetical protein [Planctomycetota bacterium]